MAEEIIGDCRIRMIVDVPNGGQVKHTYSQGTLWESQSDGKKVVLVVQIRSRLSRRLEAV